MQKEKKKTEKICARVNINVSRDREKNNFPRGKEGAGVRAQIKIKTPGENTKETV
jgi:hypothetical protein